MSDPAIGSGNRSDLDRLVLETIRQHSSDTVYFKDTESRFLWNSMDHAKQCGAPDPEEMVGKTDFDYFPGEFAQKAREIEVEIMRTGTPILNIPEELIREGLPTEYYLASKYPWYDGDGKLLGTWGISKNITAQKLMELELEKSYRKVQRLARVDDLTGLYNRRYFYEMLDRTIGLYDRRSEDSTFAIIAIDVDDMKYINDQHGQPCGDEVLRHVASSMLFSVRKTDICFRIGGDEFMVILPDCDKLHALSVAKKIGDRVAGTPVGISEDRTESVTVSLGVAAYEKGVDISELISLADRKLYKSTRNGKNQVSF